MQIEIQLFAAAREAVGSEKIVAEVPSGAVVADLFDVVAKQFPQLAGLLPSCRLAIDNCFAAADATLPSDSEYALIPPVSGG
jgi:molybdopterin synthase catalytic subunit/molybdopterin synthase sulfur carrier subunit